MQLCILRPRGTSNHSRFSHIFRCKQRCSFAAQCSRCQVQCTGYGHTARTRFDCRHPDNLQNGYLRLSTALPRATREREKMRLIWPEVVGFDPLGRRWWREMFIRAARSAVGLLVVTPAENRSIAPAITRGQQPRGRTPEDLPGECSVARVGGTARVPQCRRLRHARAERRYGGSWQEGGARAASPPR